MRNVTLHEAIEQRVRQVQTADILVGVPSYNNAGTIAHVVRAVQAGLRKYFPDMRAVLVNSDGGSTDGTTQVVQDTTFDDSHSLFISYQETPFFKITAPYCGIPGKGSAFRTIFEIARVLDAKACAVVDADLRSITPEWVELLIKPVLHQGFDYVAPLYQRHKYDGTITNSIIYPLTRALYGKKVRQPIGGDFGFSGVLAQFYLTKDVWETDVARYGIDIWMTTTAIANGFTLGQAYLGAKIHDPKDPGSDLSDMLYQVVGATFDLMETYADKWSLVNGSEGVSTFGFRYGVGLEPVSVNVERMLERFRFGVNELLPLWELFLSSRSLDRLQSLVGISKEAFHLSDELWVEIVYGFALAFHRRLINTQHLLRSLTPLYIGKTASFVLETWENGPDEVERKIEILCQCFEEQKNSFMKGWMEGGSR